LLALLGARHNLHVSRIRVKGDLDLKISLPCAVVGVQNAVFFEELKKSEKSFQKNRNLSTFNKDAGLFEMVAWVLTNSFSRCNPM